MNTVTISSEYRVVIPKTIRQSMNLEAGTKLQIFQYENRIELIPEYKIKKRRGFLHGIDTVVKRERDRE